MGVLLVALAVTLFVELPVAAVLGLRTQRALVTVLGVNLITNPLLNLALVCGCKAIGPAASAAYPTAVAGLEAIVIVVEWRLLLYALSGRSRQMLAASLAMNASSLAVGIAVSAALLR
jgi:hypothetical protein